MCGKGAMFGRSHRHKRGVAGGRWKKKAPKTQRLFKANIQKVSIMGEKGPVGNMKLCTKCIKRIRKDDVNDKRHLLQLEAAS